MLDGKMHQTTVRFSQDLWLALETECKALGVSVAQYLREAAVARMAYTAGQAGDLAYEAALSASGGFPPNQSAQSVAEPLGLTPTPRDAWDSAPASEAVRAQSALVLSRSRELRERSAELRRIRREQESRWQGSQRKPAVAAASRTNR